MEDVDEGDEDEDYVSDDACKDEQGRTRWLWAEWTVEDTEADTSYKVLCELLD